MATETVYTSNQVPEWLDTALQGLVSDAGTLTSEAYPAYQGEQVAGLTDLQNQAIRMLCMQNTGLTHLLLLQQPEELSQRSSLFLRSVIFMR